MRGDRFSRTTSNSQNGEMQDQKSPTPGPSVVEQYWTGVASQLQVEAGVFSRLVGHNGEMGRANELALTQLVTSLLPAGAGVGTGVVIDSEGGRSAQTDLVIYDKGAQPQILAHSTQLLFPVETVFAVVEVKTTVSSAEIHDAGRKFASVRKLVPAGAGRVPLAAFFGYSATSAPSARAGELNALPAEQSPDVACILDPGVVSSRSGHELKMGMVPLHAVDDSGARQSRQWIYQSRPGRSVHGDTSYPVAGLQTYKDWVVFEPGRALLLFAEGLLRALSERTGWNVSWLTAYVTDVARETVIPPAPS